MDRSQTAPVLNLMAPLEEDDYRAIHRACFGVELLEPLSADLQRRLAHLLGLFSQDELSKPSVRLRSAAEDMLASPPDAAVVTRLKIWEIEAKSLRRMRRAGPRP